MTEDRTRDTRDDEQAPKPDDNEKHPLHVAQDRVAAWFGVTPTSRHNTLLDALIRPRQERVTYWLHLLIAMGIATLGLVLGSTAVVIGAMLVSPLMGPIVELGLGLAAGSPYLVLRSMARVLWSIAAVVAAAALIAIALPFHEVNDEIAARTSPNALDLIIAVFCALVAVFTFTRGRDADGGAAAGTAIGISLVPPLCVAGYGVGTMNEDVAVGAGLLFTANLSAIVFVSSVVLWVLGYARTNALALERSRLDDPELRETLMWRLSTTLRGAVGSRLGPVLRWIMPIAILAAVFLPLREALTEVAWEVRVRTELQHVLASHDRELVESRMVVERHTVAVHIVLVGVPDDATRIEREVTTRVQQVGGVTPTFASVVLPDAAALDALRSSMRLTDATPAPVPVRPALTDELALARAAWPTSAGRVLAVRHSVDENTLRATYVHLGPPIGPPALELLSADLGARLSHPISLSEIAIVERTTSPTSPDDSSWLLALERALGQVTDVPGVRVCVAQPEPAADTIDPLRAPLETVLDGRPEAELGGGPTYAFWISTSACFPPPPAQVVPPLEPTETPPPPP